MNRMFRSIVFGGATAIALAAGPARAHEMEDARRPAPPVSVRAPVHLARWDRDRPEMRREYAEFTAAREQFYRGWHGDRRDRYRFERWCAARRAELDRRWAHERDRW
jgi:hypothetical protein